MSEIIDGKTISQNIEKNLAEKIREFGLKPKLVIIQVGNIEESNTYIKHKIAFAERIGVIVEYKKYDQLVKEEEIVSDIVKYNKDNSVHGVIVQLPLPEYLSTTNILESIDRKKDVDGLTSGSTNSLLRNENGFVSGATKAVLNIVDSMKLDLSGKKVVIVGHSTLVGKPTSLALMNRNATVTVCHEFTKNLAEETRRADILVTAVGHPNLITVDHINSEQIVIDIGITVTPNKKVVGDVDYNNVKDKVKFITPVPGGIGPMTIACLFENLIEACLSHR
jgi:methylenetetrahydrofolate dehydrogenase (NADP+)/methenyltetrahydrofolate cyclohydrolase